MEYIGEVAGDVVGATAFEGGAEGMGGSVIDALGTEQEGAGADGNGREGSRMQALSPLPELPTFFRERRKCLAVIPREHV
jgi:hypothetical protein